MTPEANGTFETLLARYVAGGLPAPARVLVESHLELRPESRAFVSGLESLAGEALSAAVPIALGNRQERLSAIFDSASLPLAARATSGSMFPRALRDFVGFDADEVPWRTKLPGMKLHDIGEIDGCQASLFWLKPGRKIPDHTHDGSEIFLVLDGAFSDAFGHYGRGEISIADETVDHRPIADREKPCVGFSVTDGALRLTGPLHRRLADIIGL